MDILSYLIGYKKGKDSGGSGGGFVDEFDGLYWRQEVYLPSVTKDYARPSFVLDNELYTIITNTGTSKKEIWKMGENEWTYVCDGPTGDLACGVEFNGLVYIFGYDNTKLWTFDGAAVTAQSDLPAKTYEYSCAFVFNGDLYASLYGTTFTNRHFYRLTADGWVKISEFGDMTIYPAKGVAVAGNKVYFITDSTELYCFDGVNFAQIPDPAGFNSDHQLLSDGKGVYLPHSLSTGIFYKLVDDEFVECKRRLPIDRVLQRNQWAAFNGRVHFLGGVSGTSNKFIHMSCAMG